MTEELKPARAKQIPCRWPACEDDTDCMNGCKPAPVRSPAQGEPAAWSLMFEDGKVNPETTYRTREKAELYAKTCGHPTPKVVALYVDLPAERAPINLTAIADDCRGAAKEYDDMAGRGRKISAETVANAYRRIADYLDDAAASRSPAANAEQRRAEVCAAVAHVLHGRNRQCDYPIYETQDDRGLDEAEYIDFAMDVLASLRSRSQPVTASQREIAINLLGWPSPEKAAEALLSKFNVTCKTTEEPRG